MCPQSGWKAISAGLFLYENKVWFVLVKKNTYKNIQKSLKLYTKRFKSDIIYVYLCKRGATDGQKCWNMDFKCWNYIKSAFYRPLQRDFDIRRYMYDLNNTKFAFGK